MEGIFPLKGLGILGHDDIPKRKKTLRGNDLYKSRRGGLSRGESKWREKLLLAETEKLAEGVACTGKGSYEGLLTSLRELKEGFKAVQDLVSSIQQRFLGCNTQTMDWGDLLCTKGGGSNV